MLYPVLVCLGIGGDGEDGGAAGDGDGQGVVFGMIVGGASVSNGVDAGSGGSRLAGFLCWFDVGEGVLSVVLGAAVAGVAERGSVGSGCFRC